MHLGEQHSKDTSTAGMGSEDRDMSITGLLHRNGRLRENISNETDGDRSVTADGTSRGMSTTPEHMAKCKYNWQHVPYTCNLRGIYDLIMF